MRNNEKTKMYSTKQTWVFFIVVGVLSIICETIIVVKQAMGLTVFLMWIPAFAALVAGLFFRKENDKKYKLRELLGVKKTNVKYLIQAVVVPLIYIGISYAMYWIIFPNNLHIENYVSLIILAVAGIFTSLITALGEEIGWRGFMLPALLERVGTKKALLISSIVWAGWHIPILISGLYMPGTPVYYKVPAFVLCIIPVSIIAGILTIKSNSVWPAAFLHAAHNNFDQSVFGNITLGDKKMFFVSETGIFTIICAWIIAICWMVKTNIHNDNELFYVSRSKQRNVSGEEK